MCVHRPLSGAVFDGELLAHRAFETAEEGIQYCEEQFLTVAEKHGLCSTDMPAMSLADILALHSPVSLIPSQHCKGL